MVLTKLPIFPTLNKSSSLQIPFMLLKEFLILQYIHIKSIRYLFLANSGSSLKEVSKIPLNSGIVLVIAIGVYIWLLIKKWRNLISLLFFHTNLLGILVGKMNVIIFLTARKYISKLQTIKDNIFWNFLIITCDLLYHQ